MADHHGFNIGDRVTLPYAHTVGAVFVITEWVETPGLGPEQNDCIIRDERTGETSWAPTSAMRQA